MSSPRLLLVDDDSRLRQAMRQLLEIIELEVVGEAINGQDGVELVRVLRPDIVLMDWRMPVMDGLEATKQITALGLPTQVIMLTAYANETFEDEAREAGAVALVPKGVTPARVIRAIDEAWRTRPSEAPFRSGNRARHAAKPR